MELVEEKVEIAQVKAGKVQPSSQTTMAIVNNLKTSKTPKSVLFSTISRKRSRDCMNKAIVTPLLKYL